MARIGTVGYLNARPLTDRVNIDRHTLVLAHPAEVARLLRQGEVDVALIPVAAALTDGHYRVVPRVCIGADGPVHSVLLVAEQPPEEWRQVRLDGVSRTSRVLARLLLAGPLASRVSADLALVDVPPNEGVAGAGGDVAALVIGDAARELDPRWTVRIDLAEAWTAWTGLPFVFAVWAGRPDLPADVVQDLAEAGVEGVDAVRSTYAGADLRYLTESLRYTLDDRALMGLRRFGALAKAAGLVAREDVELYGPGTARHARPAVGGLLRRAVEGVRLSRAELGLLHLHAPLADLASAAHELRLARHAAGTVGYWVGGLQDAPNDPAGIATVRVGGDEPLVDQLVSLRNAQDERIRFTGVRVWADEAPGAYGSSANTAVDHQRAVALARIALDNVPHCHASPATEGLGMAQASLRMGCDHLGTVVLQGEPESWPAQLEAVERHIRGAGFEPERQELPGPRPTSVSAGASAV